MPIRSEDSLVGAWAFLCGVVLAVVIGLLTLVSSYTVSPLLLTILSVLGLIVGFFVSENDVKTYLLASVSVVVVSFMGIQGLVLNAAVFGVAVNRVVSSILGALLFLFIPSTVIVAMKTVFSIARS